MKKIQGLQALHGATLLIEPWILTITLTLGQRHFCFLSICHTHFCFTIVRERQLHFFFMTVHQRHFCFLLVCQRYFDAILPPKGIGQKALRRLGQRCKRRPQGSHEPQVRFRAHGLSINPLIFVHIRLKFHSFWVLYLGLHNVGRVPQKYRIFQP